MTTDRSRTPTPIDTLAEDWLITLLDLQPELHVELGRPGREADYTDFSPEGHQAHDEASKSMLTRVRAAAPLDAVDEVTRLELIRVLELNSANFDAGFWRRDLNVIASPVQSVRDIFDLMSTENESDWSQVAKRMHNIPAALSGYEASLQAGINAAQMPAIRQVHEVAAQTRKQMRADNFFASMADNAAKAGVAASLQSDLASGAQAASRAYGELVAFFEDELAPCAPTDDALGPELYAIASRGFIGAEIDLHETYAWGIDELQRMVAEQESIAAEILTGASVKEAIAHLEQDPVRKLHGTDALRAWMQATSDQAVRDLSSSHFDIPEHMRTIECMIAPTKEGGICYTPPSDDFSRPGRMWWSVPEGVTEFDTWRELTTVYHEGVPGHHLQCGLAIDNRDQLNAWRRMNWNSGYGEGWALYAERLMADMGHLDDPADRLGMLDGQRMRAARVVLDIGVHLRLPKPDGSGPWTGDDAFGFLAQHVNMNEPFVRFETNRYLGWGGQAPSYKVGQRIWEQIRDDWMAAGRGTLKEFHRQALGLGAVGLDTLRTTLLA